MTSQGNRRPVVYQVSISGQIRTLLLQLHAQAVGEGKGLPFMAALRQILVGVFGIAGIGTAGRANPGRRDVHRWGAGLALLAGPNWSKEFWAALHSLS